MYDKIEAENSKLTKRLNELNTSHIKFEAQYHKEQDTFHHIFQNEREHLNKALLDLEDTVMINEAIDAKVGTIMDKIRSLYDGELLDIKDNIRKIWRENLNVPELKGEDDASKYLNFRAYQMAMNDDLKKRLGQVDAKLTKQCDSNSNNIRHKLIKLHSEVTETLNKEQEKQKQ